MKLRKAIFFDRDGVLIEAPIVDKKPNSIKKLKQLKFCKGIKKICNYYKKNYHLIMVTNQPDFHRKINSKKNINEINMYIKKKLNLNTIYVCFSDNEKHKDRKPNPGMLNRARKRYNLDLTKSYMIGDRWRDIGAGNKANCKTIFIDRNYKEKSKFIPNYKIKRLSEIFSIIIKDESL